MDHGGSPWDDEPSRSTPSLTGSKPQATDYLSASTPSVKQPGGRDRGKPRRGGGTLAPLQSIEGDNDPLGPLSASTADLQTPAEVPPTPPKKEVTPRQARAGAQQTPPAGTRTAASNGAPTTFTGPNGFSAPVMGRTTSSGSRPGSSHVGQLQSPTGQAPAEQLALPKFEIIVGDPHKVGDLTSSHIVYQVRTKTNSKAFRNPEFAVTRRYRDFLWLYNQLHSTAPGYIVPPPPEKQAVGRFESNFVETRRAALERMLSKISQHYVLSTDQDFKLFLESETFNVDVRHKVKEPPLVGETNKGFLGLGIGGSTAPKYVERDDYFHAQSIYMDALEKQLKSLLKSVDMVVKQRKELADSAGDFSASLHNLSAVEISPSLSSPLEGLADVQTRIQELYNRQAQQDVLTIGITIDEYIRLIASVKIAFANRQKSFGSWQTAIEALEKKRGTQEKLMRQGRSQQDRIQVMNDEVAEAERKVNSLRLLFDDMGRLMRSELERFEREKVEDFKAGIETFLESAVEAQKELIELWETFLMQLDQEEEGKPFQMPVGIPHTPLTPNAPPEEETSTQSNDEVGQKGVDEARLSGETEVGRQSMEGTEGSETVRGSTEEGRVEQ